VTSTHSRRSFLGRGAAAGLGIAFACIQSGPGRVFAITGPWGRPSNAPR
jgi:hypothetical protein